MYLMRTTLLAVSLVLYTALSVISWAQVKDEDNAPFIKETYERTIRSNLYGKFQISCSFMRSLTKPGSYSWFWDVTWTPEEKRYKDLLVTAYGILKEYDCIKVRESTATAEASSNLAFLSRLYLHIGEYTVSLFAYEFQLKGGVPVSCKFIGSTEGEEYDDVHPSKIIAEWKDYTTYPSFFAVRRDAFTSLLASTLDNSNYESIEGIKKAVDNGRLFPYRIPEEIGEHCVLYVEIKPHSTGLSTYYQGKVAVVPTGLLGLKTIKNLRTSRAITIIFMDEEGFRLASYTIIPNQWTSIVITDDETKKSHRISLRHDITTISMNGKPAKIAILYSSD